MTTKKDLVEAHSFSRRRLVTAFLSGAPGGREVEPSRPGRTVVGGVAIGVLLIAGAAIASFLHPRDRVDWNQQAGLVITDGGTRYLVGEHGRPRPVLNLTSVQLVHGLGVEATVVDQSAVDKEKPGSVIGIEGAPERLPGPGSFINSGWTACTDDGKGVLLRVSSRPDVHPSSSVGVIVKAGTTRWLIAQDEDGQARRYRLPAAEGAMETQLVDSAQTEKVDRKWINLFPEGDPLGAEAFKKLELSGPSAAAPVGADAGAGDVIDARSHHYLLTRDGWVELSDFEAAVYTAQPGIRRVRGNLPRATREEFDRPDWPANTLTAAPGGFCALSSAENGEKGEVRLAAADVGSKAWPDGGLPGKGEVDQQVDPGKGAFFFSGDVSTPYVVDSSGTAYLLEGDKTLTGAGLNTDSGPYLSSGWLELFDESRTSLSYQLALCPPGTTKVKDDTCMQGPS